MTDEERFVRLMGELDGHDGCHFNQFFPDATFVNPVGETIHARDLYPKHLEFFAAGATYGQRLFMAANRVGKSEAGAFEVTCHVTGLYPPWWTGRRFTTPTDWWVCGTNSETTRDIVQTKLLGPWNTDGVIKPGGMIPPDLVVHTVKRPHGLPGSVETAWVTHASGGKSVINFKMYEQGRASFEGTARHGIWCDEEPPEDVYTEMLYRTATTRGIVLVTFTPLQGLSDVVKGFIQPEPEAAPFKHHTQAGWDHVPHLDAAVKAALMATTPPYQRDARTKGIPTLGAGAIYAFPESELVVPDFEIPKTWRRAFGLDAGGGAKPTAVVWGAVDPVSHTVYIYNAYRRESPEVAIHVAAIKARGDWIPGVGDAAALLLTAHDAEQLVSVYKRSGIDIELPDKAVETGIQEVWELMSAGRLKVFASCAPFLEEFRMYHRDIKGRIVKKSDHVMDAARYYVRSGRARGTSLADHERRQQDADTGGFTPGAGHAAGWMSA